MSRDIPKARKPRQSSLTLKKLTNSLKKKQALSLDDLISNVPSEKLRKRVYLSSGGKYAKYSHFLLEYAYALGYVPIHPIVTLDYYVSSTSHNFDKKEIVRDCFSLLLGSDELWVFEDKKPSFLSDTADEEKKHISQFPEGVIAELYFWLKEKPNHPVRFFTWRDIGIPKFAPKDQWSIIPTDKTDPTKESATNSFTRFGILDLGSSTVKLTVCKVDPEGEIEILHKKALTVNLAENFFETSSLQEPAIERTLQAIKDLQQEATEYSVVDIELIGTGVVREASNKKAFMKKVQEEAGLRLKVLSGDDEALLVYKAVRESINPKSGKLVVINAGGGSTEIIIDPGSKDRIYSVPIGISNLNEKFVERYPVSEATFNKMKSFIKDTVRESVKKDYPVDHLVYTGGELDYMLITGFDLEDFEYSKSHPKKISYKKIVTKSKKMRALTLEDLQAYMPANPNWMGGAIASNAILESLSEIFNVTTIIPSNKNLNDGVLLEMGKD